jgi:hypothetical protein
VLVDVGVAEADETEEVRDGLMLDELAEGDVVLDSPVRTIWTPPATIM